MSSTVDILQSATRYINIYCGLFVCVTGMIGGLLNIIVFTTLRTFRQTTCATYLITASIYNLGDSVVVLIRVFNTGFNYGLLSSSVLCKFRFFLSQYCSLVFLTCMCMATIDRFLSMTKYRHLNNMRLARCHIVCACIIWFIHGIFTFIYYDSNGTACIMTNAIFAKYYTYFYLPVLFGSLPMTIASSFALLVLYKLLTIRNQRRNIVRVSQDRQLTTMTLVHVLYVIISIIPFISFFMYTLNTTAKSTEESARNRLIDAMTSIFASSCYACPFYIYSCVSRRFRKQVIYVLVHIHLKRCHRQVNNLNNNQVGAI